MKICWWLINHFYIIGHESYRIRRKNAMQQPLRRSRSFKVTDFGTKLKLICDFLFVNNANLPPILHRFQVMATCWQTQPAYISNDKIITDISLLRLSTSCHNFIIHMLYIDCYWLVYWFMYKLRSDNVLRKIMMMMMMADYNVKFSLATGGSFSLTTSLGVIPCENRHEWYTVKN